MQSALSFYYTHTLPSSPTPRCVPPFPLHLPEQAPKRVSPTQIPKKSHPYHHYDNWPVSHTTSTPVFCAGQPSSTTFSIQKLEKNHCNDCLGYQEPVFRKQMVSSKNMQQPAPPKQDYYHHLDLQQQTEKSTQLRETSIYGGGGGRNDPQQGSYSTTTLSSTTTQYSWATLTTRSNSRLFNKWEPSIGCKLKRRFSTASTHMPVVLRERPVPPPASAKPKLLGVPSKGVADMPRRLRELFTGEGLQTDLSPKAMGSMGGQEVQLRRQPNKILKKALGASTKKRPLFTHDVLQTDQREHRMTTPSQHHQTATPSRPPCPQPANSHPAGTPSSRYQQPTSPPHHGGITAVGTVPHYNTSMHQMSLCTNTSAASNKAQPTKQHSKLKDSKKAKKGDKRPKHRKEDISNPTDFKHLAHVGWDQDGGISRQVYSHEPLDDSVRDLLRAAGQNPDHFDNPEDIKFVYEFLEERGIDRQNLQQNNAATTFPLNNYSHNQPPSNNYAQRSVSMEQHQQHGGPPLVPPVVVRRDVSAPIHHAAKQAPPPRPPPVLNGSHGRPLPQPPPQISGHHKGGQAGFHQAQHPTNGGGRQLPMLPGDGVPTRVDAGGSSHRPPPPPAPPVSNVAPLASNVPPPPPPPPPSLLQGPSPANGSSVPKPPPPPPLKVAQMSGGGDGRSNLLAQIQAGPKLKHVDGPAPDKQPIATNPPNSRDNMMMQIKQGTQLKHVDAHDSENRKSVTTVQDLGGIAGALARALEERRKNMMNSEDSDESAADQNESEWED